MKAGSKIELMVDIALLVVYSVTASPVLTGAAVHEWLSLGLTTALLVHVALHGKWIVASFSRMQCRSKRMHGGMLALTVLLFVVLAVCFVSGLMVSGAVLLAVGHYAEGYSFWNPLHAFSAKILLALLLVHVVLHLDWVIRVSRREIENECH